MGPVPADVAAGRLNEPLDDAYGRFARAAEKKALPVISEKFGDTRQRRPSARGLARGAPQRPVAARGERDWSVLPQRFESRRGRGSWATLCYVPLFV